MESSTQADLKGRDERSQSSDKAGDGKLELETAISSAGHLLPGVDRHFEDLLSRPSHPRDQFRWNPNNVENFNPLLCPHGRK